MRRAFLILLALGATAAAQENDEDDIQPPPEVVPPQPPPPPPPTVQPMPPGMVEVQEAPLPVVVEPAARPKKPRGRGVTRVSLGAGMRTLWRVPFGGAQFTLGVGTEGPRATWLFTVDLLAGASSQGLPTGHARIGFFAEGRFGRFRIGGGGRTGVLALRRATDGSAAWLITLGPYINLSYDLISIGSHGALFLGGDLGLDAVFFADTPMLNAQLYLGLRF
jgi:hypothetical protein